MKKTFKPTKKQIIALACTVIFVAAGIGAFFLVRGVVYTNGIDSTLNAAEELNRQSDFGSAAFLGDSHFDAAAYNNYWPEHIEIKNANAVDIDGYYCIYPWRGDSVRLAEMYLTRKIPSVRHPRGG